MPERYIRNVMCCCCGHYVGKTHTGAEGNAVCGKCGASLYYKVERGVIVIPTKEPTKHTAELEIPKF